MYCIYFMRLRKLPYNIYTGEAQAAFGVNITKQTDAISDCRSVLTFPRALNILRAPRTAAIELLNKTVLL